MTLTYKDNSEPKDTKPYKMLILSPYDGFEIMFNKVIAGRNDIIADIYQAPLDHVENVLSGIDLSRYEVIICRGRSGLVASRLVKLPVVTVEFSPVDILRGFRLAAIKPNKKMAFVSFFQMEETILFLADFMGFPEDTFMVPPAPQSGEEMQQLILNLHIEYGVDLFIGDGACTRCARQYGFEYILITSGSEGISSAVATAIEICNMERALVLQNSFYKTALASTGYDYAIFAEDKTLIDTSIPHSITGNQFLTSMKAHISATIRHGSVSWVTDSVAGNYKIKGSLYTQAASRYVLFICSESFKVNKRLSSFISYREAASLNDELRLVNSVSSLNALLIETMQRAPGLTPVIVAGDIGSGKATFARAVYASCGYTQSPLAEIECQSVNRKNLMSLICDEASPLYEVNTVLLFKNLEAMPIDLQQELADTISGTEFRHRIKIISTVSGTLSELILAHRLSSDLAYVLNGYQVNIPSLSGNPELVSSIASSYLNELNQTLPKQISGFDTDALNLLANFKWIYGITQFKLMVKRLALSAKSSLITAQDTANVLGEYSEQPVDTETPGSPLDLHGDLNEIMHRVVMKVLDEEDMNQSRAAKRLGVSRMTIWKHLKEDA